MKVVGWDRISYCVVHLLGGAVVSGRCIAFNCDRALCSDGRTDQAVPPKKNGKCSLYLCGSTVKTLVVVKGCSHRIFVSVVGIAPNWPGQFIARFCIKNEQLQT